MTLRKFAIALAVISAAAGFVACNSSSYDNEELILPSGTAVKSFSLAEDDSVMANLDSVFFTIDLVGGRIFNADSLPYGTKVTGLVPSITTLQTASNVELRVTRSNGTDTVYNYLTNSTEKIDFTNPVILRIASADGRNERNYTIRVNVHQVKADSLTWGNDSRTTLPTSLANPTAQRTVRKADDFYCLTQNGNSYILGLHKGDIAGLNGARPTIDDWEIRSIAFPFSPQINSFAATDEALFILDTDGNLWTSANDGTTWTATTLKWHNIYGSHLSTLLGSLDTPEGWKVQAYPSGDMQTLPSGMPVSGTSTPVSYTFPMSGQPQTLFVGGRKADGSLSPDTWGYDGHSWAKISKRPLPVALESVAIASYVTFKANANLSYTEFPSIIAFGGRDSSGVPTDTVYVSNDYGYNWKKADALLQLPAEIGAFYNAQAYVMTSTFTASIIQPQIVKPIESWDCPYIYLFGGINSNGTLNNTVWRGTINHLTFKPIE